MQNGPILAPSDSGIFGERTENVRDNSSFGLVDTILSNVSPNYS